MKLTDQEITNIIDTLETLVREDLRSVDVDALYDDMLDDCYSFDSVGGSFACMSPSRVLKEVDEVAYRCGKNDWLDGEDLVEIDGGYYEKSEVEATRRHLIENLESEDSDLEDKLSNIDEEDLSEAEKTAEQVRISNLRTLIGDAIATLNKHSF